MSSSPSSQPDDRLGRVIKQGAKRRDRKRLLAAAAVGCLALISLAALADRPGDSAQDAAVRSDVGATDRSTPASVQGADIDRSAQTTTSVTLDTTTTTSVLAVTTVIDGDDGDGRDGGAIGDRDDTSTTVLGSRTDATGPSTASSVTGSSAVARTASSASSTTASTTPGDKTLITQSHTGSTAPGPGTQGSSAPPSPNTVATVTSPRLAPLLSGATSAEIVLPTGVKASVPTTVSLNVSGRGGMDCVVVDLGDGSPRWESSCSIPTACGVRQGAPVSTETRNFTATYPSTGVKTITVWQRQRLAGTTCQAETSLLVRTTVPVDAAPVPQRVLAVKVQALADGPAVGGVLVSVRARSGELLVDTVTDRSGNASLRVPEAQLVYVEAQAPSLDRRCTWRASGSASANVAVLPLTLREVCT